MQAWKMELTLCGQSLGDMNIRRGIFQGDNLSRVSVCVAPYPFDIGPKKGKKEL